VETGWLELPGEAGNEEYVQTVYDGDRRNYSYNYDADMFTSLWTAYPLYESVTEGSNTATWKYNPNIPEKYQINITGTTSYGVNYGSTTTEGYNSELEYYARGHQIPNADRKSTSVMNSQAYYVTNSTPQIQNGFNGGIWNTLENAVRGQIPVNDTLYVVTGAAFQKKGEAARDVVWIYPRGEAESGKSCPVPNFYWKVLLKVRRDVSGKVTSAGTVGFWLPHEDLKGKDYQDYAVSVDQIEKWTGFDFFVNLPDTIEASAESNAVWNSFQGF